MAEQVEAKETFDIDKELDKVYGEREESSPSQEGNETETPEITESDSEKTAKVKDVEEDKSLSVEEKLAKIKEILNDDKTLEAYIKEKGYHKDPAWIRQRELIDKLKNEQKSALSDEDRELLNSVKQIATTPEGIRFFMKQEGYSDEAIDKRLRELGHPVTEKPGDDIELVIKELNIDPRTINEETRATITDISKIARAIFKNEMQRSLPNEINPLKETLGKITAKEQAAEFTSTMEKMIKDDGILDFVKDIEPELNKFLDENENKPNFKAEDLFNHFKELRFKLTMERLKTGKRKEVRDEKRTTLRSTKESAPHELGKLPKIGGNNPLEVSKSMDDFLEKAGYRE